MNPTPKTVIIGEEARAKLFAGVEKIANAVSATLGPQGRNVAIAQYYRAPKVTKDGVTVAEEIWLDDLIENMGAQMVRSAAAKTLDDTGDGTSTATELARAIFKSAIDAINKGANPMDLKRGIDAAVAKAIEYIKRIAIKFDGTYEIGSDKPNYYLNVATISANGDEQIGKVVSEALQKVGPKGIITIEKTNVPGITYDFTDGYTFDRGWINPYYVTDPRKMRAEYENAWVLVSTDNIFMPTSDLKQILTWVLDDPQLDANGQPRPLLIIAENISGDAFNLLLENRVKQLVPWVVVRAPAYGDRMEDLAQDIAKYTGATLHSKKTGNSTFSHLMLGTAGKVIVTKSSTVILRGGGLTQVDGAFAAGEELTEHIAGLEHALADSTNDYEKEVLTERIAKLDGGAVAIKVGAHSEMEAGEIKDRIDDSVQAARAAAEEGIVPGGGIALYRAIAPTALTTPPENVTDSWVDGVGILRQALEAPLRTIINNCGSDPQLVINRLVEQQGECKDDSWKSYGFNASTRTYGDMYEMGIMDPAKVVMCALENAASVATMMVTTQVVIADERMPEGKPSPREGLANLY